MRANTIPVFASLYQNAHDNPRQNPVRSGNVGNGCDYCDDEEQS
jgi:hypothetical protein